MPPKRSNAITPRGELPATRFGTGASAMRGITRDGKLDADGETPEATEEAEGTGVGNTEFETEGSGEGRALGSMGDGGISVSGKL